MNTELSNAIEAIDNNPKEMQAIVRMINKMYSLTRNKVHMVEQLQSSLNEFLNGFGLKEAVVACYSKSKISREKCTKTIAAAYISQIEQNRAEEYGKKSYLINGLMWFIDKSIAKKYAQDYINTNVYHLLHEKAMSRIKWPWWLEIIGAGQKQMMEMEFQLNRLNKELEELCQKEQNMAKSDIPEKDHKKENLDKQIEDFYKKLDSDKDE